MVVELETGGNIRLEDGHPSNIWYKSCADLLSSRFSKLDFESLGIHGLKVRRVTRIHNRFLRNRFEIAMRHVLASPSPSSSSSSGSTQNKKKPWRNINNNNNNNNVRHEMEYLFFTAPRQTILNSVQKGFRGVNSSIRVSNSVFAADRDRFKSNSSNSNNIFGEILISKVFLGNCCEMKQDDDNIDPQSYKGYDSVLRSSKTTTTATSYVEKVWYVLNSALVLPEYLVEFEYVHNNDEKEKETEDKEEESSSSSSSTKNGPLGELRERLELKQREFEDKMKICEMRCREAMQMPGVCPEWPQSTTIKITDSLTCLNLHGSNLDHLESLSSCSNLKTLILTFNAFKEIPKEISCLKRLEQLELGHNKIEKISSLPSSLKKLGIESNSISYLDDFTSLQDMTRLEDLNLSRNPVCRRRGYRLLLLKWVCSGSLSLSLSHTHTNIFICLVLLDSFDT